MERIESVEEGHRQPMVLPGAAGRCGGGAGEERGDGADQRLGQQLEEVRIVAADEKPFEEAARR